MHDFEYQIKYPHKIGLSAIFLIFLKRFTITILFVVVLFSSFVFGQQKTLGLIKNSSGKFMDGYVLFAPMYCKTTYLIDKCGRQVHNWKSNYYPGLSVYLLPDGHLLRTGTVVDTFFPNGSNGGVIEKIDWDGNVVWSYIISNDSIGQHHDIFPMDNGNILAIVRHVIPASKAVASGRHKGTFGGSELYSERVIEIKPIGKDSAEIVWQWSLWDHIIQDASFSKPRYDNIANHPELMNINYAPGQSQDWIHMNSVDYNKELDQILLSCHNISEIWIIDHSTTTKQAASHTGGKYGKGGDLLYRWGNPAAYDKGSKADQKFFLQHNANWIPKGYKDGGDIMVFNNGFSRIPFYSTVDIISPPINSGGSYSQSLPYGPSSQKWMYKDSIPERFYSGFISGASRLENGNTLICSGLPGKFFEIDGNNSIVWEYINPVANNDEVLKDGQTGGSGVFRCTHYSASYSGFNGKVLTPSGPIEKNSYSYSCSLIVQDNYPPKPIMFFPSINTINVPVSQVLSITFDKTIQKGNSGFVTIYESNNLKETISINDNKIVINDSFVIITPSKNFNHNSRVAIALDSGCFMDSVGNKMQRIDTSNWVFITEKKLNNDAIVAIKRGGVYPNPAKNLIRLPAINNDETHITVLNSIGQPMNLVITNKPNQELEIDISEISAGLYSIYLNNRFYQKILKN